MNIPKLHAFVRKWSRYESLRQGNTEVAQGSEWCHPGRLLPGALNKAMIIDNPKLKATVREIGHSHSFHRKSS